MSILLLRLLLTPTLVVLVSYIQKRWGHAIGGRVIGLPLSTAPFLVLIYLMDGAEQTARAAHGVVAGQIAVVSYCYIFTFINWRRAWPFALLSGWLVAGLADVSLVQLESTWLAGAIVVFVSALAGYSDMFLNRIVGFCAFMVFCGRLGCFRCPAGSRTVSGVFLSLWSSSLEIGRVCGLHIAQSVLPVEETNAT